jgi:hypothetical protein
MSVLVDLCIFLYFRDDLEYHYVPVSQKAFVGNDQTITNSVGLAFLKLVLLQIGPVHHYLYFELYLYDHISNTTYVFRLHSFLNVLFFCSLAFCTIHHRKSNHRPIELYFLVYLRSFYYRECQMFAAISHILLLFYNLHLYRFLHHSATLILNIKMCHLWVLFVRPN